MRALLTALLRPAQASLPRARLMTQQKAANIHSKPAKHDISVAESAFAMTVLTLAMLVPSGWVLAYVEDYKARK